MKLVLLGIIVLAIILRFSYIGSVPSGMFGDEVDAGYNAYSLLRTGRDYNGNWWPTHIESMGDWRPFLYIYSLIPWIGLFGLSPLSVRISSSFWGVVGVFVIYKIGKKIWNQKVGLWAALILALMPWHIHYSRTGFEVTLMVGLIGLGWWFHSKTEANPKYWIPASIVLGVSVYSYNVAKMYSVMIFGLFWSVEIANKIFRQKARRITDFKWIISGAFVFGLCLLPLVMDILGGSAISRISSLHIGTDPKIVDEIVYMRHLDEVQGITWGRLFQNKATAIGFRVFRNYLDSFSLKFLFLEGQLDIPRHNLPGWGLLFPWMLIGLISFVINIKQGMKSRNQKIVLFLLLLGPVPAALTYAGGNHTTRLSVMILPLALLVGYGFYVISTHKNGRLLLAAAFLLVTIQMVAYSHDYLHHYTQKHSTQWSYGWEPLFKQLKNYDPSKRIIITRDHSHLPFLYTAFFNQIDPFEVLALFEESKSGISKPPTDRIERYEFRTFVEQEQTIENAIYVSTSSQKLTHWEVIGQIDNADPDDKPVFLIWEPKSDLKKQI